ncbi:aminotransferase class I/II-fold pyridoxal phosphate-dependent enzyme [Waterburya agarophytonicola K14]|uniref:Aminotransferase class I/II-fold pyridoxal phosphate-dependent enzyme n=1 Tax=Waterburya agarophytonicola KI4 TaxID=2874699 RepID=A0A964BMQ9_9CYAN|nr:aminotransferase class I/II-fold pyridoxal phosphate-dependent enzyme [Waterburya agarophytonicola]MCC0176238.1 aminotransferase class I/II-fold pyridoxal phosphate-dependent enzyme [Waterburya agarophytonicola KI4]
MFSDTPLLDALIKSAQKPHAAFYAPGHKQGKGSNQRILEFLGKSVFAADLPELPELDNLFAPEGVIKQAQELASNTFGASKTWFLVNGSTCGIIAGILAVCGEGDKIILPRNIHQSAIAGLVLSGAIPIFVNPEYDPQERLAYNVTADAVRQALTAHPDTKAVMVLHPTYQGICSDLKAIADLTHQYNIPLLVDEAHGAHFAFHPDLPPSAMTVGADLTVQSTHKVLSAMTQASMLHCQGDLICPQRINKALQLLESTSPSYLLLASLDAARQQMATQGQELMDRTLNLALEARNKIAAIPNLSILEPNLKPGCDRLDITRLTINVSNLGITGFAADEILHEKLNVTCELPLLHHLTFIISLGNTPEDVHNLIQACQTLPKSLWEAVSFRASPYGKRYPLGQVPKSLWEAVSFRANPYGKRYPLGQIPKSPRKAYFAPTETVPINQASDRFCGELICPYPPGIPLLMPGEIITTEAIEYLQQVVVAGGTITGCKDPILQTIQTLK